MTPKEKAIELYNKFRNENPVMAANVRAKKQALIAVDEILKELKEFNVLDGYGIESSEYWEQVKTELNNL
jgi:hypothetical protein